MKMFITYIEMSTWLWWVDALRKDDWNAAQLKCRMLLDRRKLMFYPPYLPKDKDWRKRLFVVVIQDEWMRNIGRRFSNGNSWALDSTFFTNQYGLPLYAAIDPNQDKKNEFRYFICYAQEIWNENKDKVMKVSRWN